MSKEVDTIKEKIVKEIFSDDFINDIRDEKDKEIERLNNIIKEVREYIKDNFSNEDTSIWHEDMRKILELLDKGE